MESIKNEGLNQHEIEGARNSSMEIFRKYQYENEDFLKELKSIAENNNSISEAINRFGSIETIFNDFDVVKWGNGAIEGDSLREIDGSIQGATEHIPNVEVFKSTVDEWRARTNDIREKLKNFSGTSEEAYQLIRGWHSDYALKPLNDTPIFEKI